MLNRKTPMKRGGWSRSTPVALDRSPPLLKPLARPANYTRITDQLVVTDPKTVARRNPALLEMARGRPCLLMVPDVCNCNPETTVACHSNWSCHGKAGARKADDHYSVEGCSACHAWLDQGSAPANAKQAIFVLALVRQVRCWVRASEDRSIPPRHMHAARWALDQLLLDGVLEPDMELRCI